MYGTSANVGRPDAEQPFATDGRCYYPDSKGFSGGLIDGGTIVGSDQETACGPHGFAGAVVCGVENGIAEDEDSHRRTGRRDLLPRVRYRSASVPKRFNQLVKRRLRNAAAEIKRRRRCVHVIQPQVIVSAGTRSAGLRLAGHDRQRQGLPAVMSCGRASARVDSPRPRRRYLPWSRCKPGGRARRFCHGPAARRPGSGC